MQPRAPTVADHDAEFPHSLGPKLNVVGSGYAATQLHRTGHSSIEQHFSMSTV
jgi:hypothetical protein